MLKKAVIGTAAALSSIAAHADIRDMLADTFVRSYIGAEGNYKAYQTGRGDISRGFAFRKSNLFGPTVGFGYHINSHKTFAPMSVGVFGSFLWFYNKNVPAPSQAVGEAENVEQAARNSTDYLPHAGLVGVQLKTNIGNLGPVKLAFDFGLGSIAKENAGYLGHGIGLAGVSGKYRMSGNQFVSGGIKWVQPFRQAYKALVDETVSFSSHDPRGFATASLGITWG